MKLKISISAAVVSLIGIFVYISCTKKPEVPPPPAGTTETATQPATAPSGTSTPVATRTASPDGYQAMDAVPNGGKIIGTVSYSGTEKDSMVTVTKDTKACCSALCSGATRPAQKLVASDGKLKNVVAYLSDINKGKKFESKPVVIDNKDCAFEPHVAIGYKGDKVIAKNSDPVLHNTHLFLSQGDKDLVNIALPNKGQTVEKKLKKDGIISVKCDAHEWMQGWIFSTTHPYATVTEANGTFVMDQVPPGNYTLKLWHEKLGEKELKVSVAPNAEAKADVVYN